MCPSSDLQDAGIVARATYDSQIETSRGMASPPRCNTRKSTSRLARIATGAAHRGRAPHGRAVRKPCSLAEFRPAEPTSATTLSLAIARSRWEGLGHFRPTRSTKCARVATGWPMRVLSGVCSELSALKGQAIYGGFGVQALGAYDRVDRVEDNEIYGVSAYIGGPTPIGNFTLRNCRRIRQLGRLDADWPPGRKGSILDDGLFR